MHLRLQKHFRGLQTCNWEDFYSFHWKGLHHGEGDFNVRVDNLPPDCGELFLTGDFLSVKLIPDMTPPPDIAIRYTPGSKGSFSITLDFHKDIIPPFMIRTGISTTSQNSPVFTTIDASELKQIRVETSTMAMSNEAEKLV